MTGRHAGRVAVVTGGARGIGRVYALRLAREGAAVAVLDRADAGDVVREVEAAGGTAVAVRTDLTDPAAVDAARKEITARLGPATILVNNAGIYPNRMFDQMTFDEWRQMFTVNVDALFHTCRAFVPDMRAAGWGRIVNKTSNAIALVIPGFAHYLATKMAVIGLTRALATELADGGITVNAVGPSLVRTPGTEEGPPEFFDIVPQLQAIKREQTPDDLAGAVSFLVSDDAAFITGQTIFVDGGLVRS